MNKRKYIILFALLILPFIGRTQNELTNEYHSMRVYLTDGAPNGSGNIHHEADLAMDINTNKLYVFKKATGIWSEFGFPAANISGLIQPEQINGTLGSDTDRYEYYATSDSDNIITIPFELKTTTQIFFNGRSISYSDWTGAGTTTLTISMPVKEHDYFEIIKN